MVQFGFIVFRQECDIDFNDIAVFVINLKSLMWELCVSPVMNNYQAAAAGFGPPASPHGAGGRAGFPAASSPGPALDVYGSAADSVGYVQAASPQPSGFPAIAVSRAPLNYTPVSKFINI